jgi:opacity protein-like surface antigen
LRKLAFFVIVCSLFLLTGLASAQQGDISLGFGTLVAPGSGSCNVDTLRCPEKGGLYPTVGADVIFRKRIGFAYDVTWRGSQGIYGGCNTCAPYRPIINTFNAIYQPRVGRRIGLDLLGGIGFQDTRYYSYNYSGNCIYFGACFSSSFHFVTDVGAGLRYYFWHHVFVRPEVRYYYINNNTADFSTSNILRLGGSIGYTIGGPE